MFEYKCKVMRVVDGDTIDVNIDLGFQVWHKARVRLLGIDTPESRTRNLDEKKLGLASKERLKEMLKGRDIVLKCSKDKGKFGRVLANVEAFSPAGTKRNPKTPLDPPVYQVNQQMIEEGHAREYFGGKKIPWV